MEMTASEKSRVLAKRQKMSLSELADALNQSRQNLSNKMSRDNFSIKDLKEIAAALGCELRVEFVSKCNGEVL